MQLLISKNWQGKSYAFFSSYEQDQLFLFYFLYYLLLLLSNKTVQKKRTTKLHEDFKVEIYFTNIISATIFLKYTKTLHKIFFLSQYKKYIYFETCAPLISTYSDKIKNCHHLAWAATVSQLSKTTLTT
jgi:hypothetical protein